MGRGGRRGSCSTQKSRPEACFKVTQEKKNPSLSLFLEEAAEGVSDAAAAAAVVLLSVRVVAAVAALLLFEFLLSEVAGDGTADGS